MKTQKAQKDPEEWQWDEIRFEANTFEDVERIYTAVAAKMKYAPHVPMIRDEGLDANNDIHIGKFAAKDTELAKTIVTKHGGFNVDDW